MLKSLLNSIESLSELAFCEGINDELIQRYHPRIGEMLKLLKPIFHSIADAEIVSDEILRKAVSGLQQSVDELREIFANWQPLMSKIYFVSDKSSYLTLVSDKMH